MKVGPLTEIGDFWRFRRDLLSKTLQKSVNFDVFGHLALTPVSFHEISDVDFCPTILAKLVVFPPISACEFTKPTLH